MRIAETFLQFLLMKSITTHGFHLCILAYYSSRSVRGLLQRLQPIFLLGRNRTVHQHVCKTTLCRYRHKQRCMSIHCSCISCICTKQLRRSQQPHWRPSRSTGYIGMLNVVCLLFRPPVSATTILLNFLDGSLVGSSVMTHLNVLRIFNAYFD